MGGDEKLDVMLEMNFLRRTRLSSWFRLCL